MPSMIGNLLKREEGQGLVEYGLIIVLVSIVVIAALVTMGTRLDTLFASIGQAV